jgi:Putative adhesin
MPNRPIFALLIMTLLSFPVALLAQEVVQTQKFNYPLANSGKFTIDDTNGTIAIRCSDRNEVEITATKHADSQADLDAIRIDIKQGTSTLEVQTVYSSPGPHSGGVSYQVAVPKDLSYLQANTSNGSISAQNVSGSVSIKSENGAITATGLKGPFSLSTTSGSINADCTDVAGDGLLHTTNGSITLALPRYADALIDATTTVGRINSNLSADKVNKGVVGGSLEARLGAGSHHLEAKTTNGTISLEAR